METINSFDVVKVHPVATMIPGYRTDELDLFADQVGRAGKIHTPVTMLDDGSLLDGRARVYAAKQHELELPVIYESLDPGQITQFAIDKNLRIAGSRAAITKERLALTLCRIMAYDGLEIGTPNLPTYGYRAIRHDEKHQPKFDTEGGENNTNDWIGYASFSYAHTIYKIITELAEYNDSNFDHQLDQFLTNGWTFAKLRMLDGLAGGDEPNGLKIQSVLDIIQNYYTGEKEPSSLKDVGKWLPKIVKDDHEFDLVVDDEGLLDHTDFCTCWECEFTGNGYFGHACELCGEKKVVGLDNTICGDCIKRYCRDCKVAYTEHRTCDQCGTRYCGDTPPEECLGCPKPKPVVETQPVVEVETPVETEPTLTSTPDQINDFISKPAPEAETEPVVETEPDHQHTEPESLESQVERLEHTIKEKDSLIRFWQDKAETYASENVELKDRVKELEGILKL